MKKVRHYVWKQYGYTGIVSSRSLAGAQKEANKAAPHNPHHFVVTVKEAEKADVQHVKAMGGHVPEL